MVVASASSGNQFGNSRKAAGVASKGITVNPGDVIWSTKNPGTSYAKLGIYGSAYTYYVGKVDKNLAARLSNNSAIITTPVVSIGATYIESNSSGPIYDIVYANGVYVIGGYGLLGQSQSSTSCLAYSTDFITWTLCSASLTASVVYSLTFGNGIFIAANGRNLAYSSDGITFTNITTGATAGKSIYSVVFGNGIFVAVDTNGVSYYSSNGITWSVGSSSIYGGGTTYHFANYGTGNNALAFINGLFLTIIDSSSNVGNYTLVYTSPDGINWTQRTTTIPLNSYGFTTFNGAVTINTLGYGIAYTINGTSYTSITTGGLTATQYWFYDYSGSGYVYAFGVSGGSQFFGSTDFNTVKNNVTIIFSNFNTFYGKMKQLSNGQNVAIGTTANAFILMMFSGLNITTNLTYYIPNLSWYSTKPSNGDYYMKMY